MWTRLVAVFSRLRFAWSRSHLDEETRREFEAHLGLLVDSYIRSGLTPEEAHHAARRRFGNVALIREEIHAG